MMSLSPWYPVHMREGIKEIHINDHIDSECKSFVEDPGSTAGEMTSSQTSTPVSRLFQSSSARKLSIQPSTTKDSSILQPVSPAAVSQPGTVRKLGLPDHDSTTETKRKRQEQLIADADGDSSVKRPKVNPFLKVAPLLERMRPKTLDEVCGQELVGPHGVLRGLMSRVGCPA